MFLLRHGQFPADFGFAQRDGGEDVGVDFAGVVFGQKGYAHMVHHHMAIAVDAGEQQVAFVQEVQRVAVHFFADGCGGDLAFFAAVFFEQQRYAQLFLQCLYGFTDGGLGQVERSFGTSRAGQRHETEGVMASLTMILAGLFMVIIGPSMVHLVVWLMG